MARLPRLSLPGQLHHIVQRGNNRQAIFSSPADYQTLLDLLEEQAKKNAVAVHAYVLMGNHFHLLVTPEAADSVPRMMQAVGRRYVRYFNDSQGRSGTLWEGRYRSALIQPESWLLPCMAYMDLNPVRAGLVLEARDYPWSSHGHYVGLRSDKVVTPHSLFWALGNTPFGREAAYAEQVQAGVSAVHQLALTQSVLGGWALGTPDFVAELQKGTERRVVKTRAGRPSRKSVMG
ncbi:transposase [Polaromonas sp. A23]|uniref:REP-associated tyrosine transposase n=1 Tax=Polaromonas sp. A23 TaxID=1944133 RepID=UPI0009876A1C|nr:transposase [Polaromonas sp. A23]OOG41232.1 transposase [Polaromonas sp. A23]